MAFFHERQGNRSGHRVGLVGDGSRKLGTKVGKPLLQNSSQIVIELHEVASGSGRAGRYGQVPEYSVFR